MNRRGPALADKVRDQEPENDLTALAEELRTVVGGFVRKVRSAADTPSAASSETLGELDRGGPMSIAALARFRNVRHQSMRLVVAQLEADGLVCRVPDPADGRGQLVSISAEGHAAMLHSRAARTRWIADSLRRDASARERVALRTAIEVLRRLSAAPG